MRADNDIKRSSPLSSARALSSEGLYYSIRGDFLKEKEKVQALMSENL